MLLHSCVMTTSYATLKRIHFRDGLEKEVIYFHTRARIYKRSNTPDLNQFKNKHVTLIARIESKDNDEAFMSFETKDDAQIIVQEALKDNWDITWGYLENKTSILG